MCLAIPGKILEIHGHDAVVEVDGIRRSTNLIFIEDPKVGEFVLLHAGFAIQKWSAADVAEFDAIMSEIEKAGEAGAPPGDAP